MPDDLQRRFEMMLDRSRDYGDGGREVLETAYHTLAAGRAMGRWIDVGLEDLWAHAIKEGNSLFNDPKARWGRTTAAQTRDMIGQTTIGPWQMTIGNVQKQYGQPYGVHKDWPAERAFHFCEERPGVQAGMICDYIAISYSSLGPRGPYAIQRYFWLSAFVKGEIGAGAWDKSVLPVAPDGDWTKLTYAMKRDTGFYAKQILVGHAHNPHGLLYWLWVSGDLDAIRATLLAWKNQRDAEWDEGPADVKYLDTYSGKFAVGVDDLKYVPDEQAKAAIASCLP